MPTWGELLVEVQQIANQQAAALQIGQQPTAGPADILRRKYLKSLSDHTGRATIYYGVAWHETRPINPQTLSVDLGDVRGFMEACSSAGTGELDLILHSPGGSPDAAESIMAYLRQRFTHIRAVVPLSAMSAATMMALACDEVVMGSHSQLGPIDPQLTVQTPAGLQTAPAQAIKEQFQKAQQDCAANPGNLNAWMPLLSALAPGLLAVCDTAQKRTVDFVARELEAHMFAGDADAATKAQAAADWFADHTFFKSHGRNVSRDDARAQGVQVIDLESDPTLQDLVLSVSHATQITFSQTPCAKLIENQLGRCWMLMEGQQVIQVGLPGPPTGP